MSSLIIAGAGLTGLIAAHAFPRAQLREKASYEECVRHEHAALLRFRTDAVSRITGIPFRRVAVQKSVVMNGVHVEMNLALANRYAAKVLAATGGKISGRSIWNLAPAARYVAPLDFIAQMRATLAGRIEYGAGVALHAAPAPIITTVPLNVTLAAVGWLADTLPPLFYAPIHVARYRLSGVDLFQTIYYPGAQSDTYRASITGDVLIVESLARGDSLGQPFPHLGMSVGSVLDNFGLDCDVEAIDQKVQRYGKIVDLDPGKRRAILRTLTEEFNLYSLGRFATWRNVLLDDVANDIEVVRRLMASDPYGRDLH